MNFSIISTLVNMTKNYLIFSNFPSVSENPFFIKGIFLISLINQRNSYIFWSIFNKTLSKCFLQTQHSETLTWISLHQPNLQGPESGELSLSHCVLCYHDNVIF